jgi:hypothetical protein
MGRNVVKHADHDYVLLRDYIAGRLPDHECRTFEDRLTRDHTLARELDLSLRLSAGLEGLKSQRRFKVSGSSTSNNFSRSAFNLSWTKRLVAAAATIACVALLLWVRPTTSPAILTSTLKTETNTEAPRPVRAHFTFIGTRDSSTPELALPPDGLIELRAAPPSHELGANYSVTLVADASRGDASSADARRPAEDRTLASLTNLVVGADGYIRCYADASRLKPGTYELKIGGGSGPKSINAVYPFTLVSEPHNSP